ncbi:MAG: hypothetical protein JF597_10035 [Streptomyces sp.]|uniref:DUF6879 family protein n=1 Tax=Streptomyces sp. TaxID=1931 RepID=UPI0025D19641|nr:hypothetical protein [Streptomyces sp.]MBW8793911.1 hypothetical protein [Streptomyces sp.]
MAATPIASTRPKVTPKPCAWSPGEWAACNCYWSTTAREPGFASWEAFNRRAWQESVDLLQEEQPAIKGQFDDAESRSQVLRRARYVELPSSDHLVWEMAVLRRCGGR